MLIVEIRVLIKKKQWIPSYKLAYQKRINENLNVALNNLEHLNLEKMASNS